MSDEVIWINVIPNPNKTADNQPDWVAPPNPNAPEGKKWTIGTKIGETWWNQAGWNTKSDNGELTGGITFKLTPNSLSATGGSSGGGKPEFTPQKTFAKNTAYATNKPSGF